ncbi:MAG: winged helix-turn-helix transcriptional regulator [Candidatus Doudnabacteria bacterium]|nr:winged helix-turn-helix transcriptional regulator [Candidatus Doudnabacteria bacterium]
MRRLFAALSDDNRQKILLRLKQGELSVAEIGQTLSVTGATLSHHLEVLRTAGLVSSRRSGQQILYSLHESVFEEAAAFLVSLIRKGK